MNVSVLLAALEHRAAQLRGRSQPWEVHAAIKHTILNIDTQANVIAATAQGEKEYRLPKDGQGNTFKLDVVSFYGDGHPKSIILIKAPLLDIGKNNQSYSLAACEAPKRLCYSPYFTKDVRILTLGIFPLLGVGFYKNDRGMTVCQHEEVSVPFDPRLAEDVSKATFERFGTRRDVRELDCYYENPLNRAIREGKVTVKTKEEYMRQVKNYHFSMNKKQQDKLEFELRWVLGK